MGHQAAEAETLYFEPSKRRQPIVALTPEALADSPAARASRRTAWRRPPRGEM